MNRKIFAYIEKESEAIIEQCSIKREWMDKTPNKHAYQCMPVSLANTIGWQISFPEEISFIWDGISDNTDEHVKIISGQKFCSSARGNGTISFNSYITLKTDEDVTTLIMPVPNLFNENAQCFTALISTSFYESMIPIAWKILKPNVKIVIPPKYPVATILPISLKSLENFEMIIKEKIQTVNEMEEIKEKLKFIKTKSENGKFSHLYRKAENYKGEKVGKHETDKVNLKTTKEK